MLEITGACKVFSRGTPTEHVALDHLNLTLQDGEFVTIVGSNGAGKSTLFNAICGTFLLDEGKIVLDGPDITYMKEHKRAFSIGRVFQDPMKGTAPNLTIEENIALAYSRKKGASLRFALNKRDQMVFREALAGFQMGLEDRMKTKVGLLSGGQRQAVTLLMCTLVTPKLLLLDEHTAALDPKTAAKVLELSDKLVRENHLTAMMVTHNMRDAIYYGNRLIMMNNGRVIFDVSGEEKKNLTVEALIAKFSETSGEAFANDRALLS